MLYICNRVKFICHNLHSILPSLHPDFFFFILYTVNVTLWGFPDGSAGKESTCNARETRETQVRALGWEDPLQKEMATHSSILAWKGAWQTTVHGVTRVGHDLATKVPPLYIYTDMLWNSLQNSFIG